MKTLSKDTPIGKNPTHLLSQCTLHAFRRRLTIATKDVPSSAASCAESQVAIAPLGRPLSEFRYHKGDLSKVNNFKEQRFLQY